MTGVVIPGLVAGVIYFVIAFATGASALASIIGGIVVTLVAVAIGFVFRAGTNGGPRALTSSRRRVASR